MVYKKRAALFSVLAVVFFVPAIAIFLAVNLPAIEIQHSSFTKTKCTFLNANNVTFNLTSSTQSGSYCAISYIYPLPAGDTPFGTGDVTTCYVNTSSKASVVLTLPSTLSVNGSMPCGCTHDVDNSTTQFVNSTMRCTIMQQPLTTSPNYGGYGILAVVFFLIFTIFCIAGAIISLRVEEHSGNPTFFGF